MGRHTNEMPRDLITQEPTFARNHVVTFKITMYFVWTSVSDV